MGYSDDMDVFRLDGVQNGVGKEGSQTTSDILFKETISFGIVLNSSNCQLNLLDKSMLQSLLLLRVMGGCSPVLFKRIGMKFKSHRVTDWRT